MENNKKQIPWIRLLSFVFIFFFLLIQVTQLLTSKDGEQKQEIDYLFYNEFDKSFADVWLMGSSQTYCALTPTVIYHESGISSVNFSASNQTMVYVYYKIQEMLNDGFQPKVVVLDCVGLRTLSQEPGEDGSHFENSFRRGVLLLNSWRSKIEYVCALEDEYNGSYFGNYLFPLERFHSRWSELGKGDYYPKGDKISVEMGALLDTRIKEISASKQNGDLSLKCELNPHEVKYLLKTIDLLKQNGVDVLVVKWPDSYTDDALHNSIQEVCTQAEVDFLDLNTPNVSKILQNQYTLSYKTDFYNYDHLNAWGNEKVSRFFGKYLEQNYSLPDHRGESSYVFMDTYYKTLAQSYPEVFESK